ncbi:MAG: GNAT family N-acetyltransferase [Clostridia bacterium]
MEIIKLNKEQYSEAIELAWKVFQEYEGSDYSKEGIESFYNSIHSEEYIKQLEIFGAFKNEKLVGIIATRNNGNHIALFFVKGEEQNKGIGKKLFQRICLENSSGKITVNSSPYAVEIYHHLGFINTDNEKITDGIRYTPMEFYLENV